MPNIKVRGQGWLTSFVTDRATGGEQVEKNGSKSDLTFLRYLISSTKVWGLPVM